MECMMSAVVLSAVTEGILKKVTSLGAEELTLALGFKEEMERLKESSAMIQAVLHDAGKQQVTNTSVKRWLMRLKDVAYDADDVLDEFEYEILRQKVQIGSLTREVRTFFSSHNPIAFRFRIAHKVKNINLSLNNIKIEASVLQLVQNYTIMAPRIEQNYETHSSYQNKETHSFLDCSRVVGRENDVSNIVNMLIGSSDFDEIVAILPIVGMGGIGKSTLAKSVYNDEQVKQHFDLRIWIYVSHDFNVKKILRQILESVSKSRFKLESMDEILQSLQRGLKMKKFLLILDDVWNEKSGEWNCFISSLLGVITQGKGNTIIVTTRSDRVASIVGTLPMYRLRGLSENDCWSILSERAFVNGEASVAEDLVVIGKYVVKKCAGVPLAAKVLGGIMRSKKEKADWLSIQNNEIWNLPEDPNGILPALRISLDYLQSPSLVRCFAYCSNFPKGFKLQREILVQLWMAEGFLQPLQGSNLEMEDVGDEYFKTLLLSSLFQDAEKDECDYIKCCKMHDLVHDLAALISRSGSLCLESSGLEDSMGVREIPFFSNRDISQKYPKDGTNKLRTLFIKNVVSDNTLENFRCLRALSLLSTDVTTLPKSIGALKHLRYLDISGTRISAFPQSFAKLYNLQTLRLMDCFDLKYFPELLKNLINLRHYCINNTDRYKDVTMPIKLGQLTCLQTLPLFVVGSEMGHQIEELGCLNKLRGELAIYKLERVCTREEAKKANLLEKTGLYKLGFKWGSKREGNHNDEDVFEGLQPHPNLKGLEIENFAGEKFPSWMIQMKVNVNGSSALLPLQNLVAMKLKDCNRCVQLPTLGSLRCLKDLYIDGMNSIRCIGNEFYSYTSNDPCSSSSTETTVVFPALRRFTLRDMPNLEEWREAAGVMFPCLEELIIVRCNRLTTAPSHFPNLNELHIRGVKSSVPLANICSTLKTLRVLYIDDVSDITSLPEGLLQENRSLGSLIIWDCPKLIDIAPHLQGGCTFLRSLDILNCGELCTLPVELQSLISIEGLSINNCSNLTSIPSINGLPSLCKLEIRSCGKLSLLPSIEGLTSLRRLDIVECQVLTSLPIGIQSCTSLEQLVLEKCPNLIDIPDEDLSGLHLLTSFTLRDCKNLARLPEGFLHGLPCLKNLDIGGFSEELNYFPIISEDIKHLQRLSLWGWPKLNCLPEQLQHLTALQYLRIQEFSGVKALPEWLGNLSSLQELRIWCCKELEHFPSVEAIRRLSKLQKLYIGGCPLLKDSCASRSGPEWEKISVIPKIELDLDVIQFS